MTQTLEWPKSREGWEKYFKEVMKADSVEIKCHSIDWLVMLPNFSPEQWKIEHQERECTPTVACRVQYVLGCKKCGDWFSNGWYISKCSCGNTIPGEFVYP